MDRTQYVTNQKGGKHLKDMNGLMEEEAIKCAAQSLETLAQILLKPLMVIFCFSLPAETKLKYELFR